MGTYVTWYLAVINLAAFLLFGLDKDKARKGRYRIPEAALLGISVLGGAAGGWIGMKMFRHKTRHAKFALGMPVIIVVQALLLMYFYF